MDVSGFGTDLHPGTVHTRHGPDSTAGYDPKSQNDEDGGFHRLGLGSRFFSVFSLMVNFHFQVLEPDIRAGLDSENTATENQEVANDNDGAAGNLAQGPDKEQAHAGYEGSHHKTCDGDSSLQAGQFYAGFLGHDSVIYSSLSRTRNAKMNGS